MQKCDKGTRKSYPTVNNSINKFSKMSFSGLSKMFNLESLIFYQLKHQ